MPSERAVNILEIIVRDYVRNATPVSSGRVLEVGNIDLSSASIRNIMADLEDEGYIYQPHTSAGRVPTQQGYRFFIDNCMQEHKPLRGMEHRLRQAASIREAVKIIAEEAHAFIIADTDEMDAFFNFGMRELLQEPELRNADIAAEFGDMIDAVLESRGSYHTFIPKGGIGIFIEEENPVRAMRHVSMLASPLGEGNGVLLALGPMRMDYERMVPLMRASAYELTRLYYER